MLSGTPEGVDRRFELLNRENDLRNEAVLKALAKHKRAAAEQERSRKVEE